MNRNPGIAFTDSTYGAQREWKTFAASDGSFTEQVITHCGAAIEANAVDGDEHQRRSYPDAGGAWQGAGYTVNRGAQRWDLQRQVRFVAGTIVVLSILASIVVPGMKWLAFAVGAGLSITAITNTCLMGMMLAKLPYNRSATCDAQSIVAQLVDATPNRQARP
jgi:hypothetical protein